MTNIKQLSKNFCFLFLVDEAFDEREDGRERELRYDRVDFHTYISTMICLADFVLDKLLALVDNLPPEPRKSAPKELSKCAMTTLQYALTGQKWVHEFERLMTSGAGLDVGLLR